MKKHPRASKRTRVSSWPVSYRWLATGALAVYTAIGCKKISAAPFQTAGVATPPAARRFDIPAGNLREAALGFEAATGIRVILSVDGIAELPSPGVTGAFPPFQAMDRLVASSGVRWRSAGPREIVVELAPVAASVEVQETVSAIGTSMPKYSEGLIATQSITTVSAAVMEQQNVTTLRDAVRNVAGISLAAGEGGAQGDNLTIRGFTARNDLFIDGMRDFGSYYRDPFNTEEVEVLQGPSSVTFGRGSTGGVLNQASKAPSLNRFIAAGVDFGTDLTRRVTADIGSPVPKLGSGAAFRLNLMGNEGNVAGRDIAKNRRFGIAPSLSLGLDTATRWTFSYFHQNADDTPDYGIPWLFNGPAPVARSNHYGFRDANFLRTYADIGTVRTEHDINPDFTLRNQVRYATYGRAAQITEAQITGAVTPATPLASIVVNRNQISANSRETMLDDQLDLLTRFNTGAIRHELSAGIEASRETSDPTRLSYKNVPTTSLLNPNPDQPFTGYTVSVSSQVDTTADSLSGYVLDSATIGSKWTVAGGARWDRFNSHYAQNVGSPVAFHRVDRMPTWRGAVSYKPVSSGSVYVAAGTSFNPSAETLALSAANANLPPERNRSVEAGTRWDLVRPGLSLRAAVFNTVKENAREPDPANPLLNVLAGEQRVNGLQFQANGHVTSRWEVQAGYALLAGKLSSSQYYPAAVGARLANIPRNTFNIWNTWRLPHRWEGGLGANFVSDRTASSTTPLDPVTGLVKKVPGYWTFSAMAERPISEHVSIHANAYNLTNRYYYDQIHPAHIVPGAGRSLLVGLKFKF